MDIDSSRILHELKVPNYFPRWFCLPTQLDLTLQSDDGGDISNFSPNGEWDLLGMIICMKKSTTFIVACNSI